MSGYPRPIPPEKIDMPATSRLETLCGCTRTFDTHGGMEWHLPTRDGRRRIFRLWGYEGGGPDYNGENPGPLVLIYREVDTRSP